jgi:hypothetical protein
MVKSIKDWSKDDSKEPAIESIINKFKAGNIKIIISSI